MNEQPAPIRIVENLSPETFVNEIVPAGEPVLLKGLIRDWPAVEVGRGGDELLVRYLMGYYVGKPVEAILGPPAIQGRFFYTDDMAGLNFERRPVPMGAVLDRLLELRGEETPPSLYIQSIPVPENLPGFERDNKVGFVSPSVSPRIWIGNRLTVQTHFDLSENIACVVAGRRRFTLFPPEQLANLYPGPFELTLAGPPVSMVRLDEPDYEKYPKFREALAHARVAELEPGDAIYIPYFWWHHVKSLTPFNILVNYWWSDADPDLGSPFDCLLHGLLALRDMPPRYREVWREMFDHYVFKANGEPVEHLPPEARGALGARDAQQARRLRMMLLQSLAREVGVNLPPRR